MRSDELALKKHGQLFLCLTFEYAFVGVSLSDAKVMGGEYSNESRNVFY